MIHLDAKENYSTAAPKPTSGFCMSCCTMGLSRICLTESGLLPISRIILRCISCMLEAPPGAPNAVDPLSALRPASDPNGFAPDSPREPNGLLAAAASPPTTPEEPALPLPAPPGDGAEVDPADGDAGLPVTEPAGEAGKGGKRGPVVIHCCAYMSGLQSRKVFV